MNTDQPNNNSVRSRPKDVTADKLSKVVALRESIWMGVNPDWVTI